MSPHLDWTVNLILHLFMVKWTAGGDSGLIGVLVLERVEGEGEERGPENAINPLR